MGYTGRVIDLQGSLPNVYATPSNLVHLSTIPSSCSTRFPRFNQFFVFLIQQYL